MKNITIPVNVTQDIIIALNETEKEIQNHFQVGIAIFLFQEQKITLGQAIRLSGLSRYEFENCLSKKGIPKSKTSLKTVISDVEKLSDI